MKYLKRISRRNFIQGAAGAALAIPFLNSLEAKAQTSPKIKRLVGMQYGNGTILSNFFPSVTPTSSFNTGTGKFIKLTDIPGQVSQCFGPEFNKYRSRMLLISGLDLIGPHGHYTSYNPVTLTGYSQIDDNTSSVGSWKSVDMLLRDLPSFAAADLPLKNGFHFLTAINWYDKRSLSVDAVGNGTSITPSFVRPIDAFNQIFKNFQAPGNSAAELELKNRKSRNKSVLDLVLGNYNSLVNSSRISKDDKILLQNHADQFRAIEKNVTLLNNLVCQTPTVYHKQFDYPNYVLEKQTASELQEYIEKTINCFQDMMVIAFNCGLTQTASHLWHYGIAYPWMSTLTPLGRSMNHHTMSHQGDGNKSYSFPDYQNDISEVTKYTYKHLYNLLEKLDTPDSLNPGETLLNNTLVVTCAELSDASGHGRQSMPLALFGDAGGLIKMNRYINYNLGTIPLAENQYSTLGLPYNNFLISLLKHFNVPQSSYERIPGSGFGDWGVDFIAASSMTTAATYNLRINQYLKYIGKNDILPGIDKA
jgi:hypothetical protein